MMKFRYRLSWLLLVPVVLAVVVWWFKPPTVPSFDYLGVPDPKHANIYWVKSRYMQDLLVLYELRDCEYAVFAIGAGYNHDDVSQFVSLKSLSESYRGRVPFFLYDLSGEVWPYESLSLETKLPKAYQPGMKSQGFVGLVHRGKIIATLSLLGEHLMPDEYRKKIDERLPRRYKL